MGLIRRDRQYCYVERKPCMKWVQSYFKDCLCNSMDGVSFGLGLVSVSCWGLAEVPQIIQNFKVKSTHGVSLLLLLTWILGDVFNLAGCLLEPSTLPTQFYTALLYTVGSSILVCQCIYYGHIVQWKKRKAKKNIQVVVTKEDSPTMPLLIPKCLDSSEDSDTDGALLIPGGHSYYTSARSLATSPLTLEPRFHFSNSVGLGEQNEENTPSQMGLFINQSRRVLNAVAGSGTLIATLASLPNHTSALNMMILKVEDQNNSYGQLLGWGMAVIYISGRIPQIWLNMKRGNVDGLSPLMFIFALVANITYVLSILVRSMNWVNLKANMPWLLDAAICVSLDLFILLQFVYYRCKKSKQNKYSILPEAKASTTLV